MSEQHEKVSGKWIAAMAFIGICIVWMIWAVWAWGSSPKFNQNVTLQDIQTLMAQRGLKKCSEGNLVYDEVPGYVRGKLITASTSCTLDSEPIQLSILEFDSQESRNAAQQRAATTHRNGYGPGYVYTYGPYVIVVQGNRSIANQALLGEALSNASNE